MKMAFSTLACPDWTMQQIAKTASCCGYAGIELRFVQGEDSLYKLPAFTREGLVETRQLLSDGALKICCVDTSCRFHSPDTNERQKWIVEGERMADLAAELGSPAIRVFGDQIQPGADRESTRAWIAESIHELNRKIAGRGVAVWLETHGHFASAAETTAILHASKSDGVGIVWDAANCWLESGETPQQGVAGMQNAVVHVHVKDLGKRDERWVPVLMGEGSFPLEEMRSALRNIGYDGYTSFEWEKRWHPQIPAAEVALPHFARWFREHWNV
jgi:sugar phosphate isomerase/epimerase